MVVSSEKLGVEANLVIAPGYRRKSKKPTARHDSAFRPGLRTNQIMCQGQSGPRREAEINHIIRSCAVVDRKAAANEEHQRLDVVLHNSDVLARVTHKTRAAQQRVLEML